MQISIKYSDYRSLRCLFSEKASFETIFGQNFGNTVEKQQPKTSNKDKSGFLFERANVLSKKPARKIGSKSKNKPVFF